MSGVLGRIRARVAKSLLARRLRKRSPLAVEVAENRLTYLSNAKLVRIVAAREHTRRLGGDVCEFGVALGGSGIVLARGMGPQQRFFGFDVFAMIPPPASQKDDEKSKKRHEVIASGRSEGIGSDPYYGYRDDLYEHVCETFRRHGVPPGGGRIHLVKGLFEETLPLAGIDAIALAHIDCDWYDPVVLCLEYCSARMVPSGIIVIDDYNDYGGCRQAVDEFLAANPEWNVEPGPNPFLKRR